MTKMIIYFVIVALIVIFASQNMAVVPVYLIVGSPLIVPLIVVVAMSVFIGYAFAVFSVVLRAAKSRNQKPAKTASSGSRPPVRGVIENNARR